MQDVESFAEQGVWYKQIVVFHIESCKKINVTIYSYTSK